jgi:hypothetical protein
MMADEPDDRAVLIWALDLAIAAARFDGREPLARAALGLLAALEAGHPLTLLPPAGRPLGLDELRALGAQRARWLGESDR